MEWRNSGHYIGSDAVFLRLLSAISQRLFEQVEIEPAEAQLAVTEIEYGHAFTEALFEFRMPVYVHQLELDLAPGNMRLDLLAHAFAQAAVGARIHQELGRTHGPGSTSGQPDAAHCFESFRVMQG